MSYKIETYIPRERYGELLTLIHESFDEHKRAGLNFTCSSYTLNDIETTVLNNYYFVAVDENNRILGITAVHFNEKDKTAYENITAISPFAKGQGIGSALYKERTKLLRSLDCKYLLSDTAVSAHSSVRWHLERCNCRIVDYRSFKSTNYYSYVFREDFVPISLFQRIKDRYRFIKSCIYFHVFYTPEGKLSKLGKIRMGNKEEEQ